jgi:hypothetical protein
VVEHENDLGCHSTQQQCTALQRLSKSALAFVLSVYEWYIQRTTNNSVTTAAAIATATAIAATVSGGHSTQTAMRLTIRQCTLVLTAAATWHAPTMLQLSMCCQHLSCNLYGKLSKQQTTALTLASAIIELSTAKTTMTTMTSICRYCGVTS